MPGRHDNRARVPPRWVVRTVWSAHRGLYRLSGGRLGLRRARPDRWGVMSLTTTGRRTGQQRPVMLGYLDDGANPMALAMNGWADAEPAWWLNLQHQPDATMDLVTGPRSVTARAATGDERGRLWARWLELDPHLDDFAARRSGTTAIVVFEPRTDGDG